MAVQITTYSGLKTGVLAWLARTGDTLIDGRFDDFLLNCERRMWYGHATEDAGNPLRSDPLRIVEMETVDPLFDLSGLDDPSGVTGVRITLLDGVRVVEDYEIADPSGMVGQPPGFLELISAQLNSPNAPLQIVSQRTIDGYGTQSVGGTRLIAVSGSNFRVLDAPTTTTYATLRYYQTLATPTVGGTVNTILTRYPDVYLHGCLVEAAIFSQDEPAALRYLQLYNASVAGLNARTQRITASAVPVIRLRAGMIV